VTIRDVFNKEYSRPVSDDMLVVVENRPKSILVDFGRSKNEFLEVALINQFR
jgi:hypothetical protein